MIFQISRWTIETLGFDQTHLFLQAIIKWSLSNGREQKNELGLDIVSHLSSFGRV